MNDLNLNRSDSLVSISLLKLADASIVYALIDESRNELKNLVWSQTATLESTTNFIEYKIRSLDSIYGVFYDDNLIGVLELRKKEDMFELGYWVGSKYRGKGFMKIAVKQLVDSETKFHTITAHIRETNEASHKILQNAGLTFDHVETWQGEQWVHLKREKAI
jgi:RimJ/RimL family protein N-acetyltransferase